MKPTRKPSRRAANPRAFPLSPITVALIAAASAAYPDGLVEQVLSPKTGRVKRPRVGDTLAEFIAHEIAEVTRDETNPEDAASIAANTIRRARHELDAVLFALVDAEAKAYDAANEADSMAGVKRDMRALRDGRA